MNRTPVADWQQLSALYELADTLDPVSLGDWLEQLGAQAHPLLPQLQQMLDARSQVRHNGFLGTLPRLPTTPEPRAVEWQADSRIGPYRLLRRLGAGGMAEVWLAQRDDGAFQRQVAIKLLFRNGRSDERDSFAQRFDRERDILASLNHPHIAGLHDAGVTPAGQPWLALEYVEGQMLTTWCDARCLGIEARVRLFRQVLLAVQHAHANLVIHRDLKPGNILVTAQGDVRLLDFGIAKLMEPEGGASVETELTRMAGRPMTPQYASPEQLLGQPLTTACDVYALGVVLYELLCGERPYELKLDSAAQLEQSILDVEPRGPSRRVVTEVAASARGTTTIVLRKTLASDLDAIVLRALAKQPTQRYSSAEAFRSDLDHWLAGEPVEARVPSAAYRLRKFVQRHRGAVALSAGAVLSLIGITAVAVVMGLQAREDSARAGAARDFMLGLFKRADQEKARGADITARELLETGRKDVMTRMVVQPRLQAELLQGIGTIQRDMGEYAGADSTFSDAAHIYGQLGMSRQAAFARSEEANAAVRMGNVKLAETALQQAKDVPNRPVADAELNARMFLVEGWIAVLKGNMVQANGLFQQSFDDASRTFGPNHEKTIDALRGRIYAEQKLRNFDIALGLLRQLEVNVTRNSAGDPKELAHLAMDRAELLNSAGRQADLLEHVIAALAKCISDLGPNYVDCRELMFRKVDVMLRLGLAPGAVGDLPALEALARDSTSPLLGAGALLLMLRLEAAVGSTAQVAELSERVRSLVESYASVKLSENYKIKALLTLAEMKLRVNDPTSAERWIGQALAFQRRSDGSVPRTMSGALTKSLQGISLVQRGRAADALASLLSARDDLSQLLGPDHPTTQAFSLNVAIALELVGRPRDALALVERAEPLLRKAMGADAPTHLRISELRSHLKRRIESEASVINPSGSGRDLSRYSPTDFFT